MVPAATRPGAPGLVFLHGGFAFGADDFTQLGLFLDDGWAVMTPTFRGENGNPGHFELFLGEVDDAANAVRWLVQQPGIDPAKIVVIGHSAGGGVAPMLSLVPDLPLALTASAGGFYHESVSLGWQDMAPFNAMARESRRIRVLHPHVKHMQRRRTTWPLLMATADAPWCPSSAREDLAVDARRRAAREACARCFRPAPAQRERGRG